MSRAGAGLLFVIYGANRLCQSAFTGSLAQPGNPAWCVKRDNRQKTMVMIQQRIEPRQKT